MPDGMELNPNYLVRISQQGGGKVQGFVPETFQLAVSSQFGQPFGQGLMNSTIGTASKATLGVALTSQSMTAQIWEGSNPIEMTLEIEFVAESDPRSEVLQPIQSLLEMALPSKSKGFLLAPPGPKYSDIIDWEAMAGGTKGEGAAANQISLHVGKFLTFDNIVIENVNVTFHSMMHSSGIPMRATVAVTFKTFFVLLKEDMVDLFARVG